MRDNYINKPWRDLAEQSAGFERGLRRFFQACARDQVACSGFGADDPWAAWDELVESADASPIPADGYAADPRPVDGDDIRWAATGEVYLKELWGELGLALKMAQDGDGSLIRELVDIDYERNDDGTYGPGTTSTSRSARRSSATRVTSASTSTSARTPGASSTTPSSTAATSSSTTGLWPERDKDAYGGPFKVSDSKPTPLVIANTYDPATPYRGALRLVRQLGNARLITMRGDGHTAYPGESSCIDTAAEAYVNELTLPAKGTVCRQEVQFEAPVLAKAKARSAAAAARDRRVTGARIPSGPWPRRLGGARRGSRTPRRSGARAPGGRPRGSARAAHDAAVERPGDAASPSAPGRYGRISGAEPEAAAQHDAVALVQEDVDHQRVAHAARVVADLAADDRRHARVVERVGREADPRRRQERDPRAHAARCRRPRPDGGSVPQCALGARARPGARCELELVRRRVPDPVAQRVVGVPVEPPVDHLAR